MPRWRGARPPTPLAPCPWTRQAPRLHAPLVQSPSARWPATSWDLLKGTCSPSGLCPPAQGPAWWALQAPRLPLVTGAHGGAQSSSRPGGLRRGGGLVPSHRWDQAKPLGWEEAEARKGTPHPSRRWLQGAELASRPGSGQGPCPACPWSPSTGRPVGRPGLGVWDAGCDTRLPLCPVLPLSKARTPLSSGSPSA